MTVGAGDGMASWSVVWAIVIHNVVEGILIAVPLRMAAYSAMVSFAIAQVAGLA